jgi:hypothetical protein
MKVWGQKIATRGPPGALRPSLSSPPNFFFELGSCQRRASSVPISAPMLWRVPA